MKFVFLILSVIFVSSSIFAAEAKEIKWIINHYPQTYFIDAANKMNEVLKNESSDLVIKPIFDKNVSWEIEKKYPMTRYQVRGGAYEMGQVYTFYLTDFQPELKLFDLPFIFESHEHFSNVVESDLFKKFTDKLSNFDLVPLAFTYSGGMAAVPANKKITTIEDFKGLKYKAWEHEVNQSLHFNLATKIINPAGFRNENIFPLQKMMQADAVDAGDCEIIELKNLKGIKNINYNLLNHRMLSTLIVFNKTFYETLTEKQKTDLQKAVKIAAKFERDQIAADESKVIEELKKEGFPIHRPTSKELSSLKKGMKTVYQKFESNIGKDLINKVQKFKK